MDELEVEAFWQSHPCGDGKVGGLHDANNSDHERFFREFDNYRYTKHKHLLKCLTEIDLSGKRVLEIGLGQGADSEQIIKRGAIWSGVDLTHESVSRVTTRLNMRQLPYNGISQASVLHLPFEDDVFDVVFSHGVLHHVPNIRYAQKEINRVLTKNGELIIMLYARWSLNYLLSISVLRRLGLAFLYYSNLNPSGIYRQHLANARQIGLANYLRMTNFIHRNTDGPLNPYSKVYDIMGVRRDFPDFTVIRAYKRFMHAPPLPVNLLPLGRMLGWHLWVHLRPAK